MPLLIPAGLSLLAAVVIFACFRLSARSRRPKVLRIGGSITAFGITLLWVLPWWLLSADRGNWAMPMFIGVMFVAVSVLGAGIQLIARACGAAAQTHNDRLFDDFIRHNDLP